MKKNTIRRVLFIVLSALYLLIFVGMVACLSISSIDNYVSRETRLRFGWDVEKKQNGTITYIDPIYESKERALAASKELALDIQAGGTVLLENDGALPLKKEERNVSVFGTGSVNIAYGGTGSGEGNGAKGVTDLYAALEKNGFTVNGKLRDFYLKKHRAGYRRGDGTDMNGGYNGKCGSRNYGYSINEIERNAYSEVRSSYLEYSDAAIIVISRSGGEGQDLPTSMREFYEGDDKHYLELTDEEYDLISEVKSGGFKKVILLLNTLNTFECGFLKQDEYAVNAALWIGGTGQHGMTAVAEILTGKREPSGRLGDTYAYDLLSAPAMKNYGDNRFVEDGKTTTAAYVAYEESIYVGYRYYETRFADVATCKSNAGDFDYDKEVVYPFGYGLSYTRFVWSDFKVEEDGDSLTFSVYVYNDGGETGRDVVQIYLQKPYTDYDRETGVEKAAVELIGYVKTPEIQPNNGKTVEVTVDRSKLASYDAYGYKTYVAEAGKYYVTAAKNAHIAGVNVLSHCGYGEESGLVGEIKLEENEFYSTSATGYGITNRFETDGYSSRPEDMRRLTRSDWVNSYPTAYGDGGVSGKATKTFTADIKSKILNVGEGAHLGQNNDKVDYIYDPITKTVQKIEIGKPTVSSGEGLNFIDAVDGEGNVWQYDDERWMRLVQCMSKSELYALISSGFCKSMQVGSINKRTSITSDSPMGLQTGTLFPCYPVQAATFDIELAERMGEAIAAEAYFDNIRGWYAPACNMHRTPFGGRNYEYYSEDCTLAGVYAAEVVKAVQAGGLFVQIKHFALNDQDTNRGDRGNFNNGDPYNGLVTYADEQAIREIYLKPFEYAVVKGGAHGVMTSYNRIGETWAGGHYGLLTEVLRNEWGMQGIALTDYAGTFGYKYMNFNQGLRAGGSQWLHPSEAFPADDINSDSAIYYMQKAAKDILFAEAHSTRINNQRLSNGESIQIGFSLPLWKSLAIVFLICLSVGYGIYCYLTLKKIYAEKKN